MEDFTNNVVYNVPKEHLKSLQNTSCYPLVSHHVIYYSFYIMLTGRTSVYIDTTKTDEDPPPEKKEEEEKDKDKEKSGENDDANLMKKKKLDRSNYGKFIINFGESFQDSKLFDSVDKHLQNYKTYLKLPFQHRP